MDGTLTIEVGTLRDLIKLGWLNGASLGAYPTVRAVAWGLRGLRRLQESSSIERVRHNASHHYDLGNELYELFLDRDLQYSCAYFSSPDEDLEIAQERKKRHIAAKLCLEPGQRILDIGSGWGGLALSLAEWADVEVVGVTLAGEQHRIARERARALGLEERVHFELRDYRELDGCFDRVVSIGMFEHVGLRHYDEFFGKLRELLAPRGIALLHSIGQMTPPRETSPWLKHIFPSAYMPSLSEVLPAVERSGLWVTDVEILRLHYAETLREWDRRFQANRKTIEELYGERFCRMWEFYLATSEVAFRDGDKMVFQMQLSRERDAAPWTRDYVIAEERRLAETH